MLGPNEKYFYWIFVPGILTYLGHYVYKSSKSANVQKYAHLKDFDKEYLG